MKGMPAEAGCRWSSLSLLSCMLSVTLTCYALKLQGCHLTSLLNCLQSQNPLCRKTESDVINAPEPETKSISFLMRHELRGPDVPELPLAEVGLVRAAALPAAVPALQPPSQAWPLNLLMPMPNAVTDLIHDSLRAGTIEAYICARTAANAHVHACCTNTVMFCYGCMPAAFASLQDSVSCCSDNTCAY